MLLLALIVILGYNFNKRYFASCPTGGAEQAWQNVMSCMKLGKTFKYDCCYK